MNVPHHIFLIGLSGSGKSAVGKILAKRLHRPLADIDRLIEKQTHRTINVIFEQKGEAAFRKMESKAIMKTCFKRNPHYIIALGGGAFEKYGNRKIVSSCGISVWLRCSLEVLSQRLKNKTDRPLLRNKRLKADSDRQELKKRLKALLKKRAKNYGKADINVSTSGKTPLAVSFEIIKKIKNKYEAY